VVDSRPPGKRQSEWTENSGRYVMSVAVLMTGVDAYRIRRYEAAGLVRPARTDGGQRLFSDRDIGRILEVSRLESEGMSMRAVAKLLSSERSEVGER
jgi:MerR family transcriptional regulator, heat shock protein HspR